MTAPKFLFLAFISLLCTRVSAQDTTYTAAVPPLDAARFAAHYITVRWTDEQYETLGRRPLELLFVVDEIGEPFLEGIRGSDDPAIRDSLVAATGRLPYFEPAYENGAAVNSLYSVRIVFPRFGQADTRPVSPWNGFARPMVPEDSLLNAYERERNVSFLDFNVTFVRHLGRPGEFLRPGGGFDMSFGGRWDKHWGAGMILGVEANSRAKPFPEDPLPDRENQGTTGGFLGAVLDYGKPIGARGTLSARTELAYATLTVANAQNNNDDPVITYRGLHTGLSLSYAWRIGRRSAYSQPQVRDLNVIYSNLNLSAGFRYRYYGNENGRGAHYFIGLGYRLGVDRYRR